MGFSLDLSSIKRFAKRFSRDTVYRAFAAVASQKATAALIGQAIADNFDKEGPGWAPLKPATIRYSIAKKVRRNIEKGVLSQMGLRSRKQLKTQILRRNFAARMNEAVTQTVGGVGHRKILQRTGLLKRSATTPGAKGNIWQARGAVITWGSQLTYAHKQNAGDPKRNLPARPYLVIRPEWQRQIDEMVINKVREIMMSVLKGGTT